LLEAESYVSPVSDNKEEKSADSPDASAASTSTGWGGVWWRSVSQSDSWQIAAAIIIGAVTALANVAFHWAIDRSHRFFWVDLGTFLHVEDLANYNIFVTGVAGIPDNWWVIPLIPMAGMTLIIILDRFFPGDVKGYGLPKFLEIVNVQGGYLRRRWITLKTLSSAITLGSGMSAGIEGPIAQIGGSIGSTVGRALRPSFDRLRVLIACGSASAIAATFSSPIAGVMFAQEIVLIGEFQAQAFYLIVIAAGTATVVSGLIGTGHSVIHAPAFEYPLNHELGFYILMGLGCGMLAVAFIRSFYGLRSYFARAPIPQTYMPLVGGLIVGTTLIFFPQIAANGYETMNAAFSGHMDVSLLLALVLVKIVMTGVTLGCGGSGGVFAPAMFIGAVFGGGFAALVNTVIPGLISEPGAFALIGMGAFLSAATHAPMTAIFLMFELTRDYNTVVPAMLTAVAATLLARRMMHDSIDSYELSQKGFDIHAGTEANILRSLYVRGLVNKDFQPIPESMAVTDFLRYVTNSHHIYFPVVDADGELSGIISMQDLRAVLADREAWPYVVVGELARKDVITIKGSDTLYEAQRVIATMGIEQIPVVDEKSPRKVIGMLTKTELEAFYRKRLLAREIHG
jgi:CIC family chloride channel protein